MTRNTRFTISILLLCIVLATCAEVSVAQENSRYAVEQVDPTVVSLNTMNKVLGSGFIVSPNGYILTNQHVIGTATESTVRLKSGRELIARVVDTDTDHDLALLKIDVINLPTVRIGDSSKLQQGDSVIAIGCPLGLDHSVSKGIISATKRIQDGNTYLQTDAALNPGSSGGPLVNLKGEVIGMNTMLIDKSQGLGFAVLIESVFPLLQKHGIAVNISIDAPSMGISPALGSTGSVAKSHPSRPDAPILPYALGLGALLGLMLVGALIIIRRKRAVAPRQGSTPPQDDLDDIDIVLQ